MVYDVYNDFLKFEFWLFFLVIGVELIGVDIVNFDDKLVEEVCVVLLKYQVVFFCDQYDLMCEQYIVFVCLFGDFEIYLVIFKNQLDLEVFCIVYGLNLKGQENNWYFDVIWCVELFLGLILCVIELLEIGGDMLFLNMVMVYEDFDEDLKEWFCKMIVVYDIVCVFVCCLNKDVLVLYEKFLLQEYLVVCMYFEIGVCGLYVNIVFIDYIFGMECDESDKLL